MKKIIDISEHNGQVDLSLAKKHIHGVVARCSWGWGDNQFDLNWIDNAGQANRLHIPLFAYHFCYARNTIEAKKEAQLALKACEKYNVNVLYYDIEYSSFQGNLSPKEYYDIAKTFCDTVENKGLAVGIYANENYFRNKLINQGFSAWTLWIANYGKNDGINHWDNEIRYNPFGNVLLHQFTSNAKKGVLSNIQGITSEGLDCSMDHGLLETFVDLKRQDESLNPKGKVKIKVKSVWYDGKPIPEFVYFDEYDVIELIGDRAVIGKGEKVTGAIKKDFLFNC